MPRWIRLAYLGMGAWIALAATFAAVGGDASFAPLDNRWIHVVLLYAVAGLCALRARHRAHERVGWLLVAAGIFAWTSGEAYYAAVLWTVDVVPFPSPADAGFLLAPVLLLAGLRRIAAQREGRLSPASLADALIAGLAVAAVSAALVLPIMVRSAPDDPVGAMVTLAYPVWDLILGSFVVGMAAASGWRLSRSWLVALAGIVLFWIADSFYLVRTADDTYVAGGWFDAGWWAGLLLLSLAAWLPAGRPLRAPVPGLRVITLPLVFAFLGLVVLVAGAITGISVPAAVLAATSLLAVMARLLLTFQANLEMLTTSRQEALLDPLTGLGNRRALMRTLEDELPRAEAADPLMLVLFDLDGFKSYNDLFGHPAGDGLLTRLGTSLARYLDGRGTAYRMGGDEFCALLQAGGQVAEPIVRGAAGALGEKGEGFTITASYGVVTLPLETTDAGEALRIADQRMYAHKHDGRTSVGRQTADVLLRVLAERDPVLNTHLQDVSGLAVRIAEALGLDEQGRGDVVRAAELHDIGKVAIPDAVLDKPGPLDEAEWRLMRTHTLIGERIIGSAPALQRVAGLVRASHERWDGAGYPDGLAGEAIPLGARIVAVADAFDAMTTDRPYRRAMPAAAALTELRACAGSQFDPVVVETLGQLLEAAPDGAAGVREPHPTA